MNEQRQRDEGRTVVQEGEPVLASLWPMEAHADLADEGVRVRFRPIYVYEAELVECAPGGQCQAAGDGAGSCGVSEGHEHGDAQCDPHTIWYQFKLRHRIYKQDGVVVREDVTGEDGAEEARGVTHGDT